MEDKTPCVKVCELRDACGGGERGWCLAELIDNVKHHREKPVPELHTKGPWKDSGLVYVTSSLGNPIVGHMINADLSSVAIVITMDDECPREEFLANVEVIRGAAEFYDWGKRALILLSKIAVSGVPLDVKLESSRLAFDFPEPPCRGEKVDEDTIRVAKMPSEDSLEALSKDELIHMVQYMTRGGVEWLETREGGFACLGCRKIIEKLDVLNGDWGSDQDEQEPTSS